MDCTPQGVGRGTGFGGTRKPWRILRCRTLGSNALGDDIGFIPPFAPLPGIEPGSPAHPHDRQEYSQLYYNDILVLEVSIVQFVWNIDPNVKNEARLRRQYTGCNKIQLLTGDNT